MIKRCDQTTRQGRTCENDAKAYVRIELLPGWFDQWAVCALHLRAWQGNFRFRGVVEGPMTKPIELDRTAPPDPPRDG